MWEPPMNIQNSKTLTLQQSTGDAILEPKDTEHWNYLYEMVDVLRFKHLDTWK